MASVDTNEGKTLGQVVDSLGVTPPTTLDIEKFYAVGAIIVLKLVPIEGPPAVDMAVLWNGDMDYITRTGMMKIATQIVDSGILFGDDEDEEEDDGEDS